MLKVLSIAAFALLCLGAAPSYGAGGDRSQNYSPYVREAAACIRCTTRCGQCSGSDRCISACKANGNPMVEATSPCGQWYKECRK